MIQALSGSYCPVRLDKLNGEDSLSMQIDSAHWYLINVEDV